MGLPDKPAPCTTLNPLQFSPRYAHREKSGGEICGGGPPFRRRQPASFTAARSSEIKIRRDLEKSTAGLAGKASELAGP
jgi:hypothetical protein